MPKITPFYTTSDEIISFIPNPADGPRAYHILIKLNGVLYIPDRTIEDLTAPEHSTKDMMRSLEAISGNTAKFTLDRCNISPEYLHIALLQLRIKEQEEELRAAYAHARI